MTPKSIKVVVGSKTEQPCVYAFDLTEALYEKIQESRKKLKEIQQANPQRKQISWNTDFYRIHPYFLRSTIIRGIEKQERDVTGLVSLAIHDKHFTRKVTEEFTIFNKDKCFYYVEEEYETDLLAYFIKNSSIPLKILFFEEFIGFMSLEEPSNIEHISYHITYGELEDAYYHMQNYYEELENPEEDDDDDEYLNDYLNY